MNPHDRKSARDQRLDCAPVSAMASTSTAVLGRVFGTPYLACAEVSMLTVMATLGFARRRARFHSPAVKT